MLTVKPLSSYDAAGLGNDPFAIVLSASVMWLPSGKREGADHADFCMEGIFLGVLIGPKSTTDDFLIVTPQGVFQARVIRRYPECNQWRIADVLAVR